MAQSEHEQGLGKSEWTDHSSEAQAPSWGFLLAPEMEAVMWDQVH